MRHHRRKRQMSEINVVPYIDVMLVLLVIFMVTAPLLMEGVSVELPKADARPVAEDAREPFVVHVDSTGTYFLNDDTEPIANPQEIRIKAEIVLRSSPDTQFLVRGDKNVKYDAVMQAMVLLQQAGVPGVGLATDTEEN
ncbi:MAG: protein TolR [Arenicellales bacterium]|jgi:biopolymer transport protein TolR|nr:protein TolR [Arenicellales bacterium]HCY14315.1 protein TolR [Gammaproteobacteria bacterium]MDP6313743.1 protein TolR [Arenicellales bacterium]MDP7192215.1 protein TolR [Arenicellales bacterium]MDP7490487.1 protein TolR [Arenicellales bacterium]|tara:strand:+ start:3167 stop:3583 length:417 start_codon:yes stop_codon:yes gene_type:complete